MARMKKYCTSLMLFLMFCGAAHAAIDWWNQPQICQVDNTRCYTNLSRGIDLDRDTGWDDGAGCLGRKRICGVAFTSGGETRTLGYLDATRGNGINPDFDIEVYVPTDDCYGARKTTQNGTMASVNGRYVRVWCNNILANPTAQLPNGEITDGPQPTCKQLANEGFAPVLNGHCYGKYYSQDSYALDCDGENPTLILLNNSEYIPGATTSISQAGANVLFNTMHSASRVQRAKYFKN